MREASKDAEFATFLESFKKNHAKSFKRVVDMRTDEQAAELLEKTFKEREDDLEMAEEFRRRRKVADLHNVAPDEEELKVLPPQYQEWVDRMEQRRKREIDFFREETQSFDSSVNLIPRKEGKELEQKFFMWEKFHLMLLHADSITNVTKLKRVSHRRILVFIGNEMGVIGYGVGVAEDYNRAYMNAVENAKRNLIVIKRDGLNTWPQYVKVRFNNVKLKFYPNKGGHVWGSPRMCVFLRMAGIIHGTFSITVKKPNNAYSMIYAFMLAMTRNQTVKDIVQKSGDKVYSYNFALSSYSQHSGLV